MASNFSDVPQQCEAAGEAGQTEDDVIEEHPGVNCDGCQVKPIRGACYRRQAQNDPEDSEDFCQKCYDKLGDDEKATLERVKGQMVTKQEEKKNNSEEAASKELPLTVERFLERIEKKLKLKFARHDSFHTLYVREDMKQILVSVTEQGMSKLFFTQLTSQGAEGGLPMNRDETPKNVGLQFRYAPNKKDVMLVEAQPPITGADRHLASSLYGENNTMQQGMNMLFSPLLHDSTNSCILLDITQWLFSFGTYFGAPAAQRAGSGTILQTIKAFPQNFFLQLIAQRAGPRPLKAGSRYDDHHPAAADQPWEEQPVSCSCCPQALTNPLAAGAADAGATTFFTVAFGQLPEVPMNPRPYDRRVGYFTTPVLIGSEKQPTSTQRAIRRWNLEGTGGKVFFHIDPAVPKLFHAAIKQGDAEFPADYQCGDARFNSIFMGEPKGLFGYGPSQADFRSGEILVANILLGFSSFVSAASRESTKVLSDAEGARRMTMWDSESRLLPADHEWVMHKFINTVVHEVGHTLGLRHNFIAAEDGHTSVMAYEELLDTTDPTNPKFGGHLRLSPGPYDFYAIKYGYTRLPNEHATRRHPALQLLANGQSLPPARFGLAQEEGLLDVEISEPRNPKYATDEDLSGPDPRVTTHMSSGIENMGRDKMAYVMAQRKLLLGKVKARKIPAHLYTTRIVGNSNKPISALWNARKLVGGVYFDNSRERAIPCAPQLIVKLLKAVTDVCIGPLYRLSAEEAQYLTYGEGTRGVQSMMSNHSHYVNKLIPGVLDPDSLERMEDQRMVTSQLSTLDLLLLLGFGPGEDTSLSLLSPLVCPYPLPRNQKGCAVVTQPADSLNKLGEDVPHAEARICLAREVNSLCFSEDVHSTAVRAGARAFVAAVLSAAANAGLSLPRITVGVAQTAPEHQMAPSGGSAMAFAHWNEFLHELTAAPHQSGGDTNPLMALLRREPTNSSVHGHPRARSLL